MTKLENELLELLAAMFEAYEYGTPCYVDPETQGGYLGRTVELDDETFNRVAEILNEHRPTTLDEF